jgi:hypothetical protein
MRFAQLFVVALVCLTAAPGVLAQSTNDAAALQGNLVTGRVVAQGKPLEKAVITVWQGFSEPSSAGPVFTAETDGNGVYRLTVPPGNYFITGAALGFVTGKENQVILNLRHLVVVGSNPIDPINFELVTEGVIKGAVTDFEGKPVAHAPVKIFPEDLSEGSMPPRYARDLRTDALGNYRITGIPAGRYRIAAGFDPVASATVFGQVGYRQVFYPDANDQTNARVIEIRPGSEVTNVNINLGQPVKTFTVTATIVDGRDGKPLEGMDYALSAFLNGKRNGDTHTRDLSNARGEITIKNVPPGEYSIRAPGVSGIVPAGQIPAAPNLFGESKRFEIIDKDVSGIEIRVMRAASVSGFVVIEGAAPSDVLSRVPQIHIVAMVMPRPGGANPIMRTNIRPDGSFTFTGLMPGKLQFNFTAPPNGGRLPLRLVRVEKDGVRLDQDPEIEAGEEMNGFRVVMGYANSGIHGVIKPDDGAYPAGTWARAILFQNGKNLEGVSADSHGEFIFQNLTAGEYTVAIMVRLPDRPEWKAERQITLADDRVTEVKISAPANQ